MAIRVATTRTQRSFHVIRERNLLSEIMPEPPPEGECVRLFSMGEFSAIGFVRYFADLYGIDHLTAFTLVIGNKHAQSLAAMADQGLIKGASFIVGKMQADRDGLDQRKGRKSGYHLNFTKLCEENDWDMHVANTHAKVYLFDTPKGKWIVESSANLNSNPWAEQYIVERSDEVYEYYKMIYDELAGKEVAHDKD